MLAFAWALHSLIDRQLVQSLDSRLLAHAASIGAALRTTPSYAGQLRAVQLAGTSLPGEDKTYLEVRTRSGRALMNSGFEGFLQSAAGSPSETRFGNLRLPDGHDGRFVILHLDAGGFVQQPLAPAWLILAQSREDLNRLDRRLDILIWADVGVALLASILISAFVIWLSTRRLRETTAAISRLSVAELAALPVEGMPTEIEPLVTQFNALIARLDAALRREETFAANLAHEIRTPITEIRAICGVEAGNGALTSDTQRSLSQIDSAAKRMQLLSEALLAVSRAEQKFVETQFEPLDLADLLRRCISQATAEAEQARLILPPQLQAPIWVRSHERLLAVVLSNLLVNALRHSEPGSTISLAWRVQDGVNSLQVRNLAPHLTQGNLQDMASRGWRAPARSPFAGQSHGIGLSIVSMLCESLHLLLAFELDDHQTLTVSISGFDDSLAA